ncbi:CDP-glycerol glycerophosphotransferase family protein [Stutzerimonas nitrititolerans]|uniref:CDP-glycerol glycerophosphotransferase family protein n=1 Tax=Stutzerimonas nitrititolerans TaxID=2482751 RepID=UPI0028B1932F|nr:CDP-glycerol glycerophosphotransferase family protein [Stutzerimonas nitrititolerans]
MRGRLVRWLLPLWWVYDRLLPKRKDCWAFFVHPLKTDQFVENARAVFEQVKADPALRKVVFTRGPATVLRLEGACNLRVVDLQSLEGLLVLARCGVFLLTNSIALDLSWRWGNGAFVVLRPSLTRRVVVNLWHGIPLKRLFALTRPELRRNVERVELRRKERVYYHGLISSSDVDSHAMAAMFHPLDPSRVWVTGLPRNDFLSMSEPALPASLREEVQAVRVLKRGRKLIVYAPTYREASVATAQYYQFSDDEIERLRALLRQHRAVLGFRMHYFRKGEQLFNLERYIDGDTIVDLGHARINEIAPVLREADLLVTDYSSVYVDALYIDKPVFSFAYDLEHYQSQQNGLLYDMELAFPGPVVATFTELLVALEQELLQPEQVASVRYRMARKFFFNHQDDCNAARVVSRLKSLMAEAQNG